ncbi:MAG: pyruvate kinase [Planctomycetota bacterium]|jgi:pyruvate kinase
MAHPPLGEFTKMAATIGPASASPEILDALLREGVDCIRINASHIKPAELPGWVRRVRESSTRMDRHIAILLDLPGIKFRIGELESPLLLHEGETVRLGRKGKGRIPVKLSRLRPYVKKGSDVFLRDGFLRLRVESVGKEEIVATVLRDGELVSRSGINLPGVSVKEQIPTKRDKEFIEKGLECGVDVFALSFVRTAKDVRRARNLVNGVPLVAKIERPEAVENIEEIAGAADGLMVARGDLAVEVEPEQLPVLQKRIVAAGNRARKVVIVATEMLASETAVGHDPVRAVRYLGRIIHTVERSLLTYDLPRPRPSHAPAGRVDWAVTDAAVDTALSIGAKAIIAFTGSGRTSRLLSAKRPSVPIYSFSPSPEVRRRCSLMWGVHADGTRPYSDINEQIDRTLAYMRKHGWVEKGDHVVVSFGSPIWKPGTKTNSLRIGQA